MPDMLVKLYELPKAESPIQGLKDQGITIRSAMSYEKYLVVGWVRRLFGEGWASECDVAFSNHPISCFIATEKGEIIGFACYHSACKNFFGPTGVTETRRGLGIGKALCLSCLYAMAAEGYAYAIIGGVGPVEFYVRTVGATLIDGSSPGIYRDQLTGNPIRL
jgi:hypothetical protein